MSENARNRISATLLVALLAAPAWGCGDSVGTGSAPSYLIVDRLAAASGAEPDEESDELSSDVVTEGGVFEDLGAASFRLALKDPGQSGSATAPSTVNAITVSRYRVTFRRTDGRNTPGVDVPYAFEGAGTVTVGTAPVEFGFVLVRIQAKLEAPLMQLRNGGGAKAISTIADVIFYGRDQAGNDTQATASISVNFADWADPD